MQEIIRFQKKNSFHILYRMFHEEIDKFLKYILEFTF